MAAKPAGSPATPKRDSRDALRRIAADDAAAAKAAEYKAVYQDWAKAPKAEKADGINHKLVPSLAVDGVVNGSSKFHHSEAEIWTENMPKHIKNYNGGIGSTLYSNYKYDRPWGADIE